MNKSGLLLIVLLAIACIARADKPSGTPADWEPPVPKPGPFWMVLGDRMESGSADGDGSYAWDVQGWYGYDWNHVRWKTEGEGEAGRSPEDAEIQLLFSRMFAPYWEWQLGIRHDFRPEAGRNHFVAGVQGVAPYEFEVEAAVFISEDGDASARIESEYELLITQRLVLQPKLELNAAFNEAKASGIESGVNNTELGLRLRYEIRREFGPYIGVEWSQGYGNTAARMRAAAADTSRTLIVAGLRSWF